MVQFLPTYEECLEICAVTDGFLFYEMKYVVQGFNVSIFDYKLASPNTFEEPVPGKSYKAHELRGLTFVWNSDGTLYNRYLLLKKFFNINQSELTQYDIIKNLTIDTVSYKEDGSLASFIKLPNGNIVAKSKGSFISDPAVAANDIINSDAHLYEFVKNSIDNNIIPIFEYVSIDNRIVLQYKGRSLILLQLRNNISGEYMSLDSVPSFIKTRLSFDYTLDEIIQLAKTEVDSEGFVVIFTNGLMVKQKTQWYFDRHGLYTDSLYRENDLIRLILSGEIDDILSVLNDPMKNKEVDLIVDKINTYKSNCLKSINILYEKYVATGYDIGAFARANNKDVSFNYVMSVINGFDINIKIEERILSETIRLENARKFLNEIVI